MGENRANRIRIGLGGLGLMILVIGYSAFAPTGPSPFATIAHGEMPHSTMSGAAK
ncbi:MAG: hypothetical protein JWN49_674 [Parcubacteria group bacterium]|nr:hypothetical protein [Parcubacteria group bacterium]